MEPRRSASGSFAPTISDDDLWEIYENNPSTSSVSRITGLAQRSVRERLAKIRLRKGIVVKTADVDRAGKLEKLVSSIPREGPEGARLREARVTIWGIGAKDQLTQQIVTEGLDSTSATYRMDGKPALTVAPRDTKLAAYRPVGARDTKQERIFVLGDVQVGFWAVRDAKDPKKFSFTPFHDERAVDVCVQAMALYRPDRVVIVGDLIDFPQLSRFQQEPEWAQTLQASIQEAYDLLRTIRKTVGATCRIDYIPGNHERRIERAIANNNPALYNLTRPGEKWPIYSLPSLLHLDRLEITLADEYPSGQVWLAKRKSRIPGLVVTHADPKKSELRADAIYGHLVLPSIDTRQVFYEEGAVTYTRMCISGCGNYSDTQDRVRLTRTNTPSGRSRMQAVQSFGTISVDRKTGLREYGLHLITDGHAPFMGRILSSSIKRPA